MTTDTVDPSISKKRVLLVDDDREDYILVQAFLERIDSKPYELLWAPNAEKFFDAIAGEKPDIILLDYMLGGQNGLELLDGLRQIDSETAVVVLTSMDDPSVDQEALQKGADAFFPKNNLSVAHLDRVLRYTLANKDKENALKQANAAKDLLFSIISHDLRSPLTSLSACATLLDERIRQNAKQEVERYVGGIRQTSEGLLNLTENLLQWSRCERGLREPFVTEFAVYDIVANVFSQQALTAQRKRIGLVNRIDRNLWAQGDLDMLGTVVRNLVSNALKFSNPGTAVTAEAKREGSTIYLFVRDEGIGIPEEMMDHLFTMNQEKIRHGTETENGTGLGLMLVKHFVEANGGTATVESEPSKGTTVTVTMRAFDTKL